MAEERLDRHSKIHHELFDENTAQVGSLGDIVEKHAGDAVFLTPPEKSVGGADGGESDFEAEMLLTDPAAGEDMDPDDLYSADDEDEVFAADQTGTVQGIARGFGTHLPQDLGRDGFQVEEIPDAALGFRRRQRDGEELDDYDNDDNTDGQFDPGALLAAASEPGVNPVLPADPDADGLTPDQIPVHSRRPHTTDDELDATRGMK